MVWDSYLALRKIFSKFNVRPLIAVVPQNEDPEFLKYPPIPIDFWTEIRDRQSEGWHVAVHGYRHRYDSRSSGILGVSKRSEFAGHSYEEQLDRLNKGKQIFERERIRVETFVAPSHSYDRNTLQALRTIGVKMVSDGFTLYPYHEDGLLFVPQLVETPRWFPCGVHTFCLHSNTMNARLLAWIEAFLERHHSSVIPFERASEFSVDSAVNRISGTVLRGVLKLKRIVAN